MLDFQKLLVQIEGVGKESLTDKGLHEELMRQAVSAYQAACQDPAAAAARLAESLPWVLWPVALPLEPFGLQFPLARWEEPVTVVASDGSQIMPSHHEIYSCYLLNIGTAVVSYATKRAPKLETHPRLFHKPEDLYPLVDRRRMHIDELYVSLERNLLELEIAVELSMQARQQEGPVVTMLDGSLIPWSVEKMPDSYQVSYMRRLERALETLKEACVPLLGYVSHSRSADLVNALRVLVCPYPVSDCRNHCGSLNEEDFPCSAIWPLSDRQLLAGMLAPQTRSAAFASGASTARCLPAAQRTCFLYMNVGYEVARLEFPYWLLGSPQTFSMAVAVAVAQVEKGIGYPVCLTEAHHLAVIRGQDRTRFFELLRRHLVALGVDRVKVSPKESRKRQSVI